MLRWLPRRATTGLELGGVTDVPVLRRLTGLRAFAALAVFVFHLNHWNVIVLPPRIAQVGVTGVAFFFVLSGFVLAWGTTPGLPVGTFYRRRFARVYPSDAVVLLVSAVVPAVVVNRDVVAALANAFLVQAWFPDPDIVYGMNGVSWSLSCEAFFYAAFPFAVMVVRRLPWRLNWTLVVLGLALAVVAYQLYPYRAYPFPLVRISEFLLGLVAGIAFREGWRPRIPTFVPWIVLLAGFAAAVWVGYPTMNAVLAVPFLVVVLHMASRDVEERAGWLGGRALVLAGEVSFAFYLVHELVIVNLLDVLPDIAALQIGVMLTAAVAAALLLHLFVERPCNRFLRGGAPSKALPGQGTGGL